ncbi:hypothetical protein QTP86_006156 [Hemibagrus guttatus]|nr:hypothetical protein QTP86_006156 [Hemibagrus guttatus]
MDPETPSTQQVLNTIIRHENSFQRHKGVLAQQETLMAWHSQLLSEVLSTIRQISDRLPPTQTASCADVPEHLPSPQVPAPRVEPHLPPPQRFSGDPSACRGFLTQCSLTFELQPSSFPSDRAKVAYVITLLSGKALTWAMSVWEAQSTFCSSFSAFEGEFRRVFDHPISSREASKRLLSLQQGNRSAAEYAIHFHTIAAGSGWNNESLLVCFQNGLSEALQDELVTREPANDLEALIDLAVQLDNQLRERGLSCQKLPLPHGSPEPMQLVGTQISPSERDRHMREWCCLYCGLSGHFRSTCPQLSGNAWSHTGKEGL